MVALWSALARVGWSNMLAATLILLALTPLLAWRWRIIARAIAIPLNWHSALVIVLIGTFFNQVLPSAIGGDAVRVWLLRNERAPLAKSLSSILLDRVVALFGMVMIVIVGFPWLMEIVRQPTVRAAATAVVAAGLAGIALLLSADKVPLPKALRSVMIVDKLLAISVDARVVFLAPHTVAPAIFASILIHLMVSAAVWILSRGIGLGVGLEVFVLLLPLVLLLSLLPISVAGWGVREGAMIACLALVGVDPTSAFALSALFGVVYFLAGLPGGLAWLLSGERSRIGKPMAPPPE